MRRVAFAVASFLLAAILIYLANERRGGAFVHALLANLAVVGWSSFVLPLGGLPRVEAYFKLRAWERSGRVFHALGVAQFRAIVRHRPLSMFNRALPEAWHAGNAERIDRETRAAEAGHLAAFGIVLALSVVSLVRGDPERAAWLAALDVPLNLYPVLLQRDHRLRLAEHRRHGDFERSV